MSEPMDSSSTTTVESTDAFILSLTITQRENITKIQNAIRKITDDITTNRATLEGQIKDLDNQLKTSNLTNDERGRISQNLLSLGMRYSQSRQQQTKKNLITSLQYYIRLYDDLFHTILSYLKLSKSTGILDIEINEAALEKKRRQETRLQNYILDIQELAQKISNYNFYMGINIIPIDDDVRIPVESGETIAPEIKEILARNLTLYSVNVNNAQNPLSILSDVRTALNAPLTTSNFFYTQQTIAPNINATTNTSFAVPPVVSENNTPSTNFNTPSTNVTSNIEDTPYSDYTVDSNKTPQNIEMTPAYDNQAPDKTPDKTQYNAEYDQDTSIPAYRNVPEPNNENLQLTDDDEEMPEEPSNNNYIPEKQKAIDTGGGKKLVLSEATTSRTRSNSENTDENAEGPQLDEIDDILNPQKFETVKNTNDDTFTIMTLMNQIDSQQKQLQSLTADREKLVQDLSTLKKKYDDIQNQVKNQAAEDDVEYSKILNRNVRLVDEKNKILQENEDLQKKYDTATKIIKNLQEEINDKKEIVAQKRKRSRSPGNIKRRYFRYVDLSIVQNKKLTELNNYLIENVENSNMKYYTYKKVLLMTQGQEIVRENPNNIFFKYNNVITFYKNLVPYYLAIINNEFDKCTKILQDYIEADTTLEEALSTVLTIEQINFKSDFWIVTYNNINALDFPIKKIFYTTYDVASFLNKLTTSFQLFQVIDYNMTENFNITLPSNTAITLSAKTTISADNNKKYMEIIKSFSNNTISSYGIVVIGVTAAVEYGNLLLYLLYQFIFDCFYIFKLDDVILSNLLYLLHTVGLQQQQSYEVIFKKTKKLRNNISFIVNQIERALNCDFIMYNFNKLKSTLNVNEMLKLFYNRSTVTNIEALKTLSNTPLTS